MKMSRDAGSIPAASTAEFETMQYGKNKKWSSTRLSPPEAKNYNFA